MALIPLTACLIFQFYPSYFPKKVRTGREKKFLKFFERYYAVLKGSFSIFEEKKFGFFLIALW